MRSVLLAALIGAAAPALAGTPKASSELRDDDGERVAVLRRLATELGASTIKIHPGYGDAGQPELVHNIQQALQTNAMIAAVRTSSNHVIVAVILTIFSCLSMVAAWIAALWMPGGS